MKNTPKSHSDYKAGLEALDDIRLLQSTEFDLKFWREVADYVNEEKRIAENMQQILEIQSTIAGISKVSLGIGQEQQLMRIRVCYPGEGALCAKVTSQLKPPRIKQESKLCTIFCLMTCCCCAMKAPVWPFQIFSAGIVVAD